MLHVRECDESISCKSKKKCMKNDGTFYNDATEILNTLYRKRKIRGKIFVGG